MILAFIPYDEISDFLDLGSTSSLEYTDSSAAKKYLIKQISTANKAGKMSDIFGMALHESIISFEGDSADIYQATQAESYRLVNVLGIPAPTNYDQWMAFLSSAEEAALSALERKKNATWANIGADTIDQTVEDVKKKADPRKSPWPFVIGGTLLLILLRR